ncbi:TetR/AcrR family transcriptional regulator [Pseudomonas sp. G11-1]|uniref:TetR/AcrR family transcriptional regulator n=1 Tax=Halopseudomonas bauzanensis TaxID=653930 RepID=A0A031MDX8_9GAMM|nr:MULTISPECIES: TetR/AcrR family transcriptional regulator [Halopseudomonas]MCO5787069.1 TetR/AcrR family transcriptional regulator [Pseudomonas sp. G11-1]MCO5790295.1 TetR/AcrR family transcriptional regulator [Pseudomonas sp. G11-2]EZQ18195.1 TetR family transcriptional regulator [Halopseudomonas bauzanensis]TKA92966.1 TetR/AcrR family transcriptional regulator [Halopseudomonas bauzanensis]WGK61570.1 TetR/AcrR family transcriptional regulator [Halopseudomonas sp. SMJS2]
MSDNKNSSGSAEHAPDPLFEARLVGIQDSSLAEQRRDQICDAALELFLQKGFASTTIRDICALSGVNQASIYDYIANKNDILRRLLNKLWFRSGVPNLHELLKQDPEASLEDCLRLYLRESWTTKRKGTILAYRAVPHLQKDDRAAMRARDQLVIQEMAMELRERADLAENDPRADIIANLIMYLAGFGPLRDWLHQDIDDDVIVDTIAAGVTAMIEKLSEHQR